MAVFEPKSFIRSQFVAESLMPFFNAVASAGTDVILLPESVVVHTGRDLVRYLKFFVQSERSTLRWRRVVPGGSNYCF